MKTITSFLTLIVLLLCNTVQAGFDPSDISGLQLCLESRFSGDLSNGTAAAVSGLPVTKWSDRSSNHRHATNGVSGPILFTSGFNEPNVLRFNATNYLSLPSLPITPTQTSWTLVSVFRVNSIQTNATIFDITEQAQSASVIIRQMWNGTAYTLQTMFRDSTFAPNMPAFSDDLSTFKIVTSTRSGNLISIRINGQLVASNSVALGSLSSGPYYATVGTVRNGFGIGNYLWGDAMAILCYDTALNDTQANQVEDYLSVNYHVPLVFPYRVQSTPVIPLGTSGSGEEARILEPSVVQTATDYKMYYCGSSSNGANLNMGWKVFLATSSNAVNWVKQGVVLTNAWEPDVILVNGTYYMVHTSDQSYSVNIASSSDGISWTEYGTIISTNTSPWSNNGPREASIYYENGTYYCYYADMAATGGKYQIGCAVCTNSPTTAANWVCQSHPIFFANYSLPRWNSGGSTESPCVRYYSDLPHPYLMTFIGYNPLGIVVNYPWRAGFAYADSPLGPWTEVRNNPVFNIGAAGGWDDRICAEATHTQVGSTMAFYYSGGKYNGSNQVGMITMHMSEIISLMK